VLSDLLNEIWTAFDSTIKGLSGGIKDAFLEIVYEDPAATTKVLSDFGKFGFLMIGLSLAVGLVYGAVRMIRG
jgi:hypothetical protein